LVLRKYVNSSRLQGITSKETYLLTCRETVKSFETDVIVSDYFKFRHKTRFGTLTKIAQQLIQVVLELKDGEKSLFTGNKISILSIPPGGEMIRHLCHTASF